MGSGGQSDQCAKREGSGTVATAGVMPAGELVTVPEPGPGLCTVSVTDCRVNVAVTLAAAVMVTMQAPVPVQPPAGPAGEGRARGRGSGERDHGVVVEGGQAGAATAYARGIAGYRAGPGA